MSRLFDDAQEEYLQIESPVVTAYPFAMVCKFRCNDNEASSCLMWCGDKDLVSAYCALLAAGGDNRKIYAQVRQYGAPASGVAVSTVGFTQDVWHHAAGIWLNVSERHAYFEGGNKGSDTITVGALAGHDRTAIGATKDITPGAWMSGDIAEAAIYDLTNWGANDAERETNFEEVIASLAKGFTPLHFPLGLKAYWPLVRGLNDRVGGYNLTASGTVVADHPRVILPQGARY